MNEVDRQSSLARIGECTVALFAAVKAHAQLASGGAAASAHSVPPMDRKALADDAKSLFKQMDMGGEAMGKRRWKVLSKNGWNRDKMEWGAFWDSRSVAQLTTIRDQLQAAANVAEEAP